MQAETTETSIRDLQAEIELLLRRREPLVVKKLRKMAVTDANIRKLFGMSMEELFQVLADKLGYMIASDQNAS